MNGINKRKDEGMNIEEAADKYATNLYLQGNATPTRKQMDDYLAYKKGFTQGANWHHAMMWGGNSKELTEAVTDFAKARYPLDIYSTQNMFSKHVACRVGFVNGAKWQRSLVWHDPEDKPEQGKTSLVQTKYGVYILGPNNEYWKETTIEMSVIRWAYTDDLLPEGGCE